MLWRRLRADFGSPGAERRREGDASHAGLAGTRAMPRIRHPGPVLAQLLRERGIIPGRNDPADLGAPWIRRLLDQVVKVDMT